MTGIDVSVKGAVRLAGRVLQAVPLVSTPALATTMERAVRLIEADLKRAMTGTKGFDPLFGVTGPPASSHTIGTRSGLTRNSVAGRVFTVGNYVSGSVGSKMRHLKLLETGGTIHGNPMLRIPLRAAQTPSGIDREAGHSVRGMDFFIWPNRAQRAGKLSRISGTYLARSVGGQLVLHYLLKQSVTFKARGLFKETAKRMQPAITAMFAGQVNLSVKMAGG